ncbi:MAG: fimbrial biosis outer rane usher protein [Ramlibacter sp.]|nr:fimbrial biosis outer rane usher protein [Ramlibacter sp.]
MKPWSSALALAVTSTAAGAITPVTAQPEPFTVAAEGGVFSLRLAWPRSSEDMPIVQVLPGGKRLVLRVPAKALGPETLVPDLQAGESPIRSLTVQISGDDGLIVMALRRPTRYEMTRAGNAWVLELRAGDVIAGAPPAAPAPLSAALEPARAETLLLEAVVNGRRLREVVQADRLADGRLALSREAWDEARLKPPAQDTAVPRGAQGFTLDAVAGLAYTVDRRRQTLNVTAPAQAFLTEAIDARPDPAAPPERPRPGILLNYDVAATLQTGAAASGGATVEGIFFNEWGSWTGSALLASSDGSYRARRLDTFWQLDLPHRMETLVLGDTVGSPGAWSRPVRFAGAHWGRDFGLRPGFVALPQPSLSGSAAVPSTVDVLIGNQQLLTRRVPPGPFELTGIPAMTGAGELNLVVRDLLGRETVVAQSYYLSPRLLARGLDDYSIDAGWLRTGYGSDTDTYTDPFATATWRRGLTAGLTGEARVELQRERRAAGVEVAALLGTWAVARASYARSTNGEDSGARLLLGVERSGDSSHSSLQWERFDAGFRQLAQVAGEVRPRERVLANLGGRIWHQATAGLSFTRQSNWNAPTVALLGASLGMPLPDRFSLSVAYSRELTGQGGWRAGVTLSRPIGDQVLATSSLTRNPDGRTSLEAQVAGTTPAGLGAGWRIATGSNEARSLAGGVNWNMPSLEASAEFEMGRNGGGAVRAGARGSLGLVAGLGFASRPVGHGAFAVVRVGEAEGVPVLRSHQVVTRTNAQGLAFVSGLLPYQTNTLEIDPAEMSLDTELGATRMDVVPYARSGATVDFAVRRSRSALVELLQDDGSVVPPGARVRPSGGGTAFTVAQRGEVYMTGLEKDNALVVDWPAGRCAASFRFPDAGEALPRIGRLRCAREKSQ